MGIEKKKKKTPFPVIWGFIFIFFRKKRHRKKIIKRKWKVENDWVSGENIFLALK